jgi:hypothetical protein
LESDRFMAVDTTEPLFDAFIQKTMIGAVR